MLRGSRPIWFIAVLVAATNAQIPIPRRKTGYVYNMGSSDAAVHLDFYIDQLCPDSKAALPTVTQLADHYGPTIFQLTSHLFPLPYHRASFYATKGLHVVAQKTNGGQVYKWLSLVYDNLDNLSTDAIHNLSDAQVVQKLSQLATQVGVDANTFTMLVDDPNIEEDTRVAWKYACTRGVAATPTFMVNDIPVAADPSWTVDQWKQVIDPLINPTLKPLRYKTETKLGDCPPNEESCEYLPGKIECCTPGENCIPNVGCRC